MQYAINGFDGSRLVSMTRSQASAAALLAEHWQRLGFTDIRIEWNGRAFDPAHFRAFRATSDFISLRESRAFA